MTIDSEKIAHWITWATIVYVSFGGYGEPSEIALTRFTERITPDIAAS